MVELCKFDQGMVLLAGVTGSGKTTTIASMLNWINANYRKHILTLEDPIEFIYTEDKCLINQREIGLDVMDFEIGMKHAVREDPDVMLVGEMRDRETFMTAIHAAETGHLVFGTIHASSAATTIGRILDLFPADMHAGLAQRHRVQHEGHRGSEAAALDQAGRQPRADGRDHDLQRHGAQADPRGKGRQAARRDPHVGAGEGMQDFTQSLMDLVQRRLDRPRGGLGSGPECRSAQNGAQRHRRLATRDPLMLRWLIVLAAAVTVLCRRCAACWPPTAEAVWPTLGDAVFARRRLVSEPLENRRRLAALSGLGPHHRLDQPGRPDRSSSSWATLEPDRVLQLLPGVAAVVDPALVWRGHVAAGDRLRGAADDLHHLSQSASANRLRQGADAASTCAAGSRASVNKIGIKMEGADDDPRELGPDLQFSAHGGRHRPRQQRQPAHRAAVARLSCRPASCSTTRWKQRATHVMLDFSGRDASAYATRSTACGTIARRWTGPTATSMLAVFKGLAALKIDDRRSPPGGQLRHGGRQGQSTPAKSPARARRPANACCCSSNAASCPSRRSTSIGMRPKMQEQLDELLQQNGPDRLFVACPAAD